MRATVEPMARTDARARTGSRHARQLAAASCLLSVRPVMIMPTRPVAMAAHRVPSGWVNTSLIWSARPPSMPASVMSSREITSDRNPATPMTNTSIGTKNRKSRNARALPTTDPAEARSRSYQRSPMSTGAWSR